MHFGRIKREGARSSQVPGVWLLRNRDAEGI